MRSLGNFWKSFASLNASTRKRFVIVVVVIAVEAVSKVDISSQSGTGGGNWGIKEDRERNILTPSFI